MRMMLIIIVPFFIVLLGLVTCWLLWGARNEPDGILAALRQLLKPDWQKLAVFAVFMFIVYAGHSQAWAFSGRELGEPPPPLYDLLKPYPFWIAWVILLAPLIMLSNLIVAVAGYSADFIGRGPFWVALIIQLTYFYTLACLIIFVGGRALRPVFGPSRS